MLIPEAEEQSDTDMQMPVFVESEFEVQELC